jgi:cellulose synthase/poly-beta-1,6-N-acetylglucosamine synthase-like glycosyltransferase
MKISVIIPTLNEEKTIGECIERARKAVESLGYECEVIVSDSSSDFAALILLVIGLQTFFFSFFLSMLAGD